MQSKRTAPRIAAMVIRAVLVVVFLPIPEKQRLVKETFFFWFMREEYQ